MRLALISGDTVINVIEAGPDYRPPFAHIAIPATETATIGDKFDGENIVSAGPTKLDLLAHAMMRNGDISYIVVEIPAMAGGAKTRVIVWEKDHRIIDLIASRAEKNPDFEHPFPQPFGRDSVMLTGKQYILLNEALTDYFMAHQRAYVGVVQAVQDGFITTHDQIDHPPERVPQWPLRLKDVHPHAGAPLFVQK